MALFGRLLTVIRMPGELALIEKIEQILANERANNDKPGAYQQGFIGGLEKAVEISREMVGE